MYKQSLRCQFVQELVSQHILRFALDLIVLLQEGSTVHHRMMQKLSKALPNCLFLPQVLTWLQMVDKSYKRSFVVAEKLHKKREKKKVIRSN